MAEKYKGKHREIKCVNCNGTGKVRVKTPDGYAMTTCGVCRGTGKV